MTGNDEGHETRVTGRTRGGYFAAAIAGMAGNALPEVSGSGAGLPPAPGLSPGLPMAAEIPGPVQGALTAFRCGLLHATGAFDPADLSGEERAGVADRKSWFWLGESVMSAFLAGILAVPAGAWFATRTELPLAVIGAAVLFLPLFVFLPKLIRWMMQVDTAAAIDAFGKNEHVRKLFWTLFLALAGLVLARIVDPATARNVLGVLTGS